MKDPTITNNILNWYDLNKRSLPWRKNVSQTKKQYYTLISEFMLQQTQVATVIPYFNRFIKNIPTIEKLSKYDDRKLIKLWEGLGYYSRVRNLKKTAQIVVKNFNKKIPRNFVDLKSLPGIGDYTASAISAIAFNEPIIPLDGNIERVLKSPSILASLKSQDAMFECLKFTPRKSASVNLVPDDMLSSLMSPSLSLSLITEILDCLRSASLKSIS